MTGVAGGGGLHSGSWRDAIIGTAFVSSGCDWRATSPPSLPFPPPGPARDDRRDDRWRRLICIRWRSRRAVPFHSLLSSAKSHLLCLLYDQCSAQPFARPLRRRGVSRMLRPIASGVYVMNRIGADLAFGVDDGHGSCPSVRPTRPVGR